jgi:hypothetical protein
MTMAAGARGGFTDLMATNVQELHVLPDPARGGWLVDAQPPAWFATAGEAERAARTSAAEAGARRIFVHDLYHRVRSVTMH